MLTCLLFVLVASVHADPTCGIMHRSYIWVFTGRHVAHKTWQEARKYCHSSSILGYTGELIRDDTGTTHRFLDKQTSGVPLWIGGFYDSGWPFDWENKWHWAIPGSGIVYSLDLDDKRWAPGEPNSKSCVVANYWTHYWDDQPCSFKLGFVCQYMLPYYSERVSGRIIDHSQYRGMGDRRTIKGAREWCRKEGGRLVVANTTKIHNWLKKRTWHDENVWVGATRDGTGPKWVWDDGTPLSADSNLWAPGAPDLGWERGPDCVMHTKNGLVDVWCYSATPQQPDPRLLFSCQLDPCPMPR